MCIHFLFWKDSQETKNMGLGTLHFHLKKYFYIISILFELTILNDFFTNKNVKLLIRTVWFLELRTIFISLERMKMRYQTFLYHPA